jgi:hypothetical protein
MAVTPQCGCKDGCPRYTNYFVPIKLDKEFIKTPMITGKPGQILSTDIDENGKTIMVWRDLTAEEKKIQEEIEKNQSNNWE